MTQQPDVIDLAAPRILLPTVQRGLCFFADLMMAPLNILVAEDNADDLFLLQQAFKRAEAPCRLQAASDGVEALAYLKGEQTFSDRVTYPSPDVLLLDLNMPRMNGFEVLEALRKDPQFGHLLIYILTASARQTDVQQAYALGATGYIVKPTRVDELVSFVKALQQWHQFVHRPPRTAKSPATAR